MLCGALSLCALLAVTPARAARLDGIRMPRIIQFNGERLFLNGLGLRTYSIFDIHIYVAALYLTHGSRSAEEILQSPETKLLTLQFEHDVSADAARKAWRDGLRNNCQAPCQLAPADINTFLTEIPAVRAGDSYSFYFTNGGVSIIVDGKQLGRIEQPQFAGAMLGMFLGPAPASPELKAELLQPKG